MNATQTRSRRGRNRLDDILIVDCDVHVHESPAALLPYCELPWSKALENLKSSSGYMAIPGFSPGTSIYQPSWPSGHEKGRRVETPEQMRAELSEIHVDIGILFPDHLLKLSVISHSEYAAALARAYNAWLVDNWCRPGDGLLGCLVACPQEPEDAAAEIARYADRPGVAGIYLPCAGIDPLWGNKKYNPIFAAAEAADLPVLLHAVQVVHPTFPFNTHGFQSDLARHSVSHAFSVMANLVDMVATGVPVRYPGLRVCATEAGIMWVPFLMNRMDKEYLEKRQEVPFLTKRPSAYLKQMYYATQPIEEPENLHDLVSIVDLYDGATQTVFASDWPHHDFDHPRKIQQVPFSEEVTRQIFGENALRLFNIDDQGRRLQPAVESVTGG